MSVEEAMEQAKTLGVMASTEPVGDENSEEKIFNFGVYKYGRDKTSLSRRILQVHHYFNPNTNTHTCRVNLTEKLLTF